MTDIRIKSLDGLRFLLAMLVVMGHFYTFIGGVTLHKFGFLINAILMSPIKAVYGFILITGFLMMHNYFIREDKEPANSKDTIFKFWLRRFFRLYPLYIVLVTIAYFSFTYLSKTAEQNLIYFTGSNLTQWGTVRPTAQPTFIDYLSHVFLIHGVFPQYNDSILGVTWSLSLEMQFYFIFPFLYLFITNGKNISKIKLAITLLFFAIVKAFTVPVVRVILNHYNLPGYKEPSFIPFIMPVFLLGMVIAAVKHKRLGYQYLLLSALLVMYKEPLFTNVIIAFLLLFIFLPEIKNTYFSFVYRGVSVIDKALSSKAAEFGANISYSLYLIHTILITLVLHLFIIKSDYFQLSKVGVIVLSIASSIVVCFLICNVLYNYIEKPFIKIGKDLIKTRFTKETIINQQAEVTN